jgi:hypothetical protein
VFDVIELNPTNAEPHGFFPLCEATLDACIAHRLARAPAFGGF